MTHCGHSINMQLAEVPVSQLYLSNFLSFDFFSLILTFKQLPVQSINNYTKQVLITPRHAISCNKLQLGPGGVGGGAYL